MAQAQREGKTPGGAVIGLDLDRFLRIDSSLRFETGNDILRQFSARLGGNLVQ